MSARRVSRRQPQRGAVPAVDLRIRNEIGAIALLAFALLSIVALIADQGPVLQWWHAFLVSGLGWGAFVVPFLLAALAVELWFGLMRRSAIIPISGGALVFIALLAIAQHYQRGEPATGQGAGGLVGATIAKIATGAFGDVGGPIALVALVLVGIVVASNRTLGDLVRPAWERRTALRPGASLPGGTAGRFGRGVDEPEDKDLDEPAPALRINMPVERPKGPAQAPKPQLRLLPPPVRDEAASAPGGAFTPSIAGLPDKNVAVEGVLHAKADRNWTLPPLDILGVGDAGHAGTSSEIRRSAEVIEQTLAHFNIAAKVVEVTPGPVVTRYELKIAPGVLLSRVESLNDNLALALAARTLRIEAPIPGKSVVGIEVPNLAVGLVSLRDVAGATIVLDLGAMPHLLVAGQTGSGKSVNISSILCSLLLNATPDDVRLLIGDLKRVDFTAFGDVPHLVAPVMTDAEKILNALFWVVGEMDRRYRLFARTSSRNIGQYNEKHTGSDRIPYVVFVIDELADLMLQAPIQVEKQITRVAQLARATGIHLVLGTQRPSVDVITGLIKANIPARIAFATASAVDSRTIIDMTGAEKLLGRGDMLVLRPDLAKPIRAQGVFVSDNEIQLISRHWTLQGGTAYDRHPKVVEGPDRLTRRESDGEDIEDERYEEAVEIIRHEGKASVSMLQRKMTIGFARAGRLIDIMERSGVVGPDRGPGKFREVYGSARPGEE